jgi:hypothetical protein
MATRKKKSDSIVPETKIVKGSHLTITYNNGYPEKLEWDDEALMRDVRAALLTAESVLAETKSKRKTGTKGK